jgi:hypothetical protein
MRVASASCASVGQPEQGAGVPGGDDAGGDPGLDLDRQLHQPDRVRHLRATASDLAGQLLVRGAELLEQLLVGRRLLEGVELDPVNVLQQGVAEHRVVGGVPDDGRNGVQAGRPRGAQPALAHDELVADAPPIGPTVLAHDDRLEQAELPYGVAELLQRLVVEDLAGLLRVGDDVVHGHLAQLRTGHTEGALRLSGARGHREGPRRPRGSGYQAHSGRRPRGCGAVPGVTLVG